MLDYPFDDPFPRTDTHADIRTLAQRILRHVERLRVS